jgi:glycine cleavage system H protein
MYPQELKYTEEHEWVRFENGLATVGITHFAQDQLGDIVDVELPEVGATVKYMRECGAIESVKTASDLFSPCTGKVVERNETLLSRIEGQKNPNFHPEQVNTDPYGAGWLFRVELADVAELDGLLDAAGYQAVIG